MHRPPIVIEADRQWAIDQAPAWAAPGFPPEGARGKPKALYWGAFVSDQAERFERYFAHDRKTPGDWSRIWRKSWWPRVDPAKLFPHLVPRDRRPHPFFRAGSPEFARALEVATPREAWIWRHVGVAQFVPDDPRVAHVMQTRKAA